MTRGTAFTERQAHLVTTARVPVAGGSVRVHVAGPAGPAGGSGRTVVLLPGFGLGAAADFALLLPMLARRHRVVAIDYVDARPADVHGAAEVVRSVLALLDVPDGAVLVGHGVGAVVAVATAGTVAPAGLVLVAGWTTPTARLHEAASVWRAVAAGAPESLPGLGRLLALDDVDAASRPVSPGPETVALLDLAIGADVTAAASAVAAPALVVGCRSDALVGVEGAHALAGALPNARYAEIDSGHAVTAERPAALLALIESFVSEPGHHPAGATLPPESV